VGFRTAIFFAKLDRKIAKNRGGQKWCFGGSSFIFFCVFVLKKVFQVGYFGTVWDTFGTVWDTLQKAVQSPIFRYSSEGQALAIVSKTAPPSLSAPLSAPVGRRER